MIGTCPAGAIQVTAQTEVAVKGKKIDVAVADLGLAWEFEALATQDAERWAMDMRTLAFRHSPSPGARRPEVALEECTDSGMPMPPTPSTPVPGGLFAVCSTFLSPSQDQIEGPQRASGSS